MSLIPSFEEVKSRVSLQDLCDALGMESRGRGKYVCPVCGSGTGPKRTAALSLKGDRWKCFSCDAGGDCFDLAGAVIGSDDKNEQHAEVCRAMGIPTEPTPTGAAPRSQTARGGARAAGRARGDGGEDGFNSALDAFKGAAVEEFEAGQRALIEECEAARLGGGTPCEGYLAARGVTPEAAGRHRIGWDAAAQRVLLPYEPDGWAWVARRTDGGEPRYIKPALRDLPEGYAMPPIANVRALADAAADECPTVWVVEGYFDMLAVEAAGGHAVALIGTAHGQAVPALAEFGGLIVAALDCDAAGREQNGDMIAALAAAGARVIDGGSLPLGAKDAGELAETEEGRTALRAHVASTNNGAWEFYRMKRREEAERRLGTMGAPDASRPLEAIRTGTAAVERMKTWIEPLDEVLGGGLPNGLTVLGATSSTGKTTLCVQIAHDVAMTARPVLYVTVEQSPIELTAKEVAREYHRINGVRIGAREILDAHERKSWTDVQKSALEAACDGVSGARHGALRYAAPDEQPTVGDIARMAEDLREVRAGMKPFVIIDYLQLLAPASDYQSDKQAIDYNVMALRQLARRMEIPILLISSLNRASYSGAVNMAAFKESGAIEYGADLLLGLQPAGIGSKNEAAAERALEEHRTKAVRECEVKVLKNRNGAIPSAPVQLTFDAIACEFEAREPIVEHLF